MNIVQLNPPRAIVVGEGLWLKRVTVSVRPPLIDTPLRSFADASAAFTYAEQLSQQRGWPIVDELSDSGPEAA